jgi:hypothetical protein
MRRSYIIASIALFALTAVWQLWIGPRWTIRVPRDTVGTTKYFGAQTNADAKTGLVPKQDVLTSYERTFRVTDAGDWPRSVVLQNKYTARGIETGAINFEYITYERIDPRTGAWAEGPHKGDIVFFPRNVQKRTYTMRSNYMAGIPLRFSGVDDIGGLETYLFSYKGAIDLTAAYSGTAESPGVKVLAGQEIRCADDQFYFRVWVERLTGRQVQVEEGCPSGDFIYDKATGQKIAAVDRWSGVTAGASLAAGITGAYQARRTYGWGALYLPGILLTGSVGLLLVGLLPGNKSALA